MLVPSKPCVVNRRLATLSMAARFSRSLGRPGPTFFMTALIATRKRALRTRMNYWTGQFSIVTIPQRSVIYLTQPARGFEPCRSVFLPPDYAPEFWSWAVQSNYADAQVKRRSRKRLRTH